MLTYRNLFTVLIPSCVLLIFHFSPFAPSLLLTLQPLHSVDGKNCLLWCTARSLIGTGKKQAKVFHPHLNMLETAQFKTNDKSYSKKLDATKRTHIERAGENQQLERENESKRFDGESEPEYMWSETLNCIKQRKLIISSFVCIFVMSVQTTSFIANLLSFSFPPHLTLSLSGPVPCCCIS